MQKRLLTLFIIVTVLLLGANLYQAKVIQQQKLEMRALFQDLVSCTAGCFGRPSAPPSYPAPNDGAIRVRYPVQ